MYRSPEVSPINDDCNVKRKSEITMFEEMIRKAIMPADITNEFVPDNAGIEKRKRRGCQAGMYVRLSSM